VNYAHRQFSVSYIEGEPILFMGLDQVRELTRRTQKRILAERPFTSLNDFLTRVDPRSQEAENLIRVGAFDGIGKIPRLLETIEGGGWQGGQLSLFSLDSGDASEEDWGLEEKVVAQEQLLGVRSADNSCSCETSWRAGAGGWNPIYAPTEARQERRIYSLFRPGGFGRYAAGRDPG
jgi:DNA polymerase III alpha subunit